MALRSPSTFWERTKDAFNEAGLDSTQEAVAKFLGISQPSISDWNKPGGYPTIENAIKLAHRANVCVEWLLTERGPRRLPPKDGAAEHLWQLWNGLNPVRQGQVLGFAQTVAETEETAKGR
jgi:transcriptional regulator with XRE-family HTH domain